MKLSCLCTRKGQGSSCRDPGEAAGKRRVRRAASEPGGRAERGLVRARTPLNIEDAGFQPAATMLLMNEGQASLQCIVN